MAMGTLFQFPPKLVKRYPGKMSREIGEGGRVVPGVPQLDIPVMGAEKRMYGFEELLFPLNM